MRDGPPGPVGTSTLDKVRTKSPRRRAGALPRVGPAQKEILDFFAYGMANGHPMRYYKNMKSTTKITEPKTRRLHTHVEITRDPNDTGLAHVEWSIDWEYDGNPKSLTADAIQANPEWQAEWERAKERVAKVNGYLVANWATFGPSIATRNTEAVENFGAPGWKITLR